MPMFWCSVLINHLHNSVGPVISHCNILNENKKEEREARAAAKARKVKINDDDGQVTEKVEVVFMDRDMRALW